MILDMKWLKMSGLEKPLRPANYTAGATCGVGDFAPFGKLMISPIHYIYIAEFVSWHDIFYLVIQEDTMDLKDFLEEASLMKGMKHPNLVQLLGM